jgi:phosphatidate cytidylyltransferase
MSDFVARLWVAAVAGAYAIAIIALGSDVFALGLLPLGWICLHELFAMFPHARPVRIAGFLGIAALLGAALWGDQFQVLMVQAALVPVLFGLVLASPVRRGATASMSLTLFGVWWVGLALAHAVLLRELPHGGAIIVDVLVGTFIGDTGAYFGGRMYGRRPLAPRISPNKTVEGLLIGMLFAIAATWFAGLYQDWLSGPDALLLGLGVALAAPVGDLFESTIKRDAGTKDTGGLFGAHGGALDRLDAVFFTIPVAFYVWSALL